MDPYSGNVAFLHTITECRTDMNVVWHYGIPVHYYRMPHRHECCVALCPFENLDSVLVLFATQRGWLRLCSKGLIFESMGQVGLPFHNFRSITDE